MTSVDLFLASSLFRSLGFVSIQNFHADLQEVPLDNEFEKRIRAEVIPANEIGVTFADIVFIMKFFVGVC